MITTDVLRTQVATRLSNVTRIAPFVVRAERNGPDNSPYAVYFFALSENIEDWASCLEQKQDELIGPSYFEAPGDLRWNHYLYLLVGSDRQASDSFLTMKNKIESDRTYARKFVLNHEDLTRTLQALEAPKKARSGPVISNISAKWVDRLIRENLGVVLDELSAPETIRQISKGVVDSQPDRLDKERKPRIPEPIATSFLDAIEIVHFRKWPSVQRFDSLGTVNLVVGSNGVGKTSLLEAIEFAYCRANARADAASNTHIRVKVKDFVQWVEVKSSGKVDELKQRNLDWYGQRDLRGSTLANSFARFNFLSTDNAAILGQRGAKLDFDEMLSLLIAGPQTAALWDHISRLAQPLATELSRVQVDLEESRKRKAVIEALIQSESSAPRASDSDFSALSEDLFRLRWLGDVTRENIGSLVVPGLARASSIVREIEATNVASDVLSPRAIFNSLKTANSNLEESEIRAAEINDIEQKLRFLVSSKDKSLKALEDIGKIESACQLGAFATIADFERVEKEIFDLQRQIGSDVASIEESGWLKSVDRPLDEQFSSAELQVQELEGEMSRLSSVLRLAHDQQKSAVAMISELRSLAKHFLQSDVAHSDCPVCASKFHAGELLEKLMTMTAGGTNDRIGPIRDALENAKLSFALVDSKRRQLKGLLSYSARRGLSSSEQTAATIWSEYNLQRASLDQMQSQLSDIVQQLETLSSFGFDRRTITALREHAVTVGINELVVTNIQVAIDQKNEEIAILDKQISLLAADRDLRVSLLSSSIQHTTNTATSVAEILGMVRAQCMRLQNVQSLVEKLSMLFDISYDDDLRSHSPRIDSAREAAERFAAAVAGEEMSRISEAKAKTDLEQIEAHLEECEVVRVRLAAAVEQITELRQSEALSDATDAELVSVQGATDMIFRKIHSPNEYGVKRSAQVPLFRLDDPDVDVTLSDISTGQRAAFVLSVFLAMNSKLQDAPPVLLFDDPVAHIDDFNALSFLDYLREVALTENRQIFYATADVKLAGLFEHKFSFLGDKFRRFDLSR